MVNVIIPISKNAKDFYEILQRLGHLESVNVQVGVCESEVQDLKLNIEEGEHMQLHCFADGSQTEEIINSLQTYIEFGHTMVMRKPITMEEFNKFITQKKDVVSCDRKHGKIKVFFFNLWQKILKLFLGVKLYDGDPSVIYVSEDITAVISQSSNLSYSSRVNRWKGISQGVVKTKAPEVKTPVDKKKNLYYIIGIIVSLALATVVTTVVCIFVKMSIIIGLLVACLDVISLSVALIFGIMVAFNSVVGKRRFSRAMEIDLSKS